MMARPQCELPVEAITRPPSIELLAQGYDWTRNTVGESGDAVYQLRRSGSRADLYLKHATEARALDLAGEMVRLQWLGSHVTVPAVCHFSASSDEAWLLMTALHGQTAHQALASHPDERIAIIDALAGFLRLLHAIPVEGCPYNSDHRLRLSEARWRLDAGLVDVDHFDAARCGWTARAVWDELRACLPFAADRVVTHGDFSLDNIIVADGMVVGCIDVGRAGIADRYQDLAILWNCLGDFGAEAQRQLLAAYGIAEPDTRKIQFHIMLDEMF